MKTFKTFAAQGDVLFRRIDAAPDDGVEVPAQNGRVVVAHSETGHHHSMEAAGVTLLERPAASTKAGVELLTLIVRDPTALEHERSHDTHEPILFEPGVYEVRRQREYTPEGFRRVED